MLTTELKTDTWYLLTNGQKVLTTHIFGRGINRQVCYLDDGKQPRRFCRIKWFAKAVKEAIANQVLPT